MASLGAVLAFVDATIVNVAFPDIRDDFGEASLSGISWVLNAYNIVFAAFIVAAGRIADLLGRKRMLELGIVLFTLTLGAVCARPHRRAADSRAGAPGDRRAGGSPFWSTCRSAWSRCCSPSGRSWRAARPGAARSPTCSAPCCWPAPPRSSRSGSSRARTGAGAAPARSCRSRRRSLWDYRLPRHSLIRGERVRAMLASNLPGTIEELRLDYFCVSGDLPTAELVVHRRGELWRAVGASMSLPGLVAPQLIGNRMLVDGGVLNNPPVGVMAGAGEGPVIAVDVTNRFEPPAEGAVNGPMRQRRFRRRAASAEGGAPLPGFAETLARALLLGSVDTAEAARTHADLVITPQNDGVGMLEFHQLDRMREAGRRAARDALGRAPEALLG